MITQKTKDPEIKTMFEMYALMKMGATIHIRELNAREGDMLLEIEKEVNKLADKLANKS